MKILGISASQRKWGNSDILVHHILKGAAFEGAETRFLRLTDFDIRQCRECLSCVFKDRDCVINDGFTEVLAALREADGVALGSPIHTLFAAGSLQMLTPRLFRQAYNGELAGKPGIAFAVGGMPGWEGWALPQVSLFFLHLGMPLVDQFVGYGQGPGEIFYDTDACDRALQAGKSLASGNTAFTGKPGGCPVCHYDFIRMRDDGRPWCMMCEIPGRWIKEEGVSRFEPLPDSRPRWERKESKEHFEKLILPSSKRFLARKEEIGQKLKTFRGE